MIITEMQTAVQDCRLPGLRQEADPGGKQWLQEADVM